MATGTSASCCDRSATPWMLVRVGRENLGSPASRFVRVMLSRSTLLILLLPRPVKDPDMQDEPCLACHLDSDCWIRMKHLGLPRRNWGVQGMHADELAARELVVPQPNEWTYSHRKRRKMV